MFAGGLQRYAQIQDKGGMNYHYALNGQQAGPVSEEELRALFAAGTIKSDTLVWRDGMAEWQQFATVFGVSGTAAVVECSVCHKVFPEDQTIRYGASVVCAGCKPEFLQRLREGAPILVGLDYAKFWPRAGAKILDTLIVMVCQWIINAIFMPFFSPGAGFRAVLMPVFGLSMSNMALGFLYPILFLHWRGQTPGKMIVGIKVVTPEGGSLSWGKCIARPFAEMLSGCILYIGFFMMLWDPEKRCLHDRIVGTRVIKVQK